MFDGAGGVDHILISFFDITERVVSEGREKAPNESLARAQRMEFLGLLSGGVAHDLNNMLGPIVGLPDSIIGDVRHLAPEDPALDGILESLQVIKTSGLRAAKVVRDLLGLSRSGCSELVPTTLYDLSHICGVGTDYEEICTTHSAVTFAHDVSVDPIHVMGVSENLTRIMHNLILNAAQSIAESGTVTIRLQTVRLVEARPCYENIPADDYAVISVCDTGEGITPQDLGHIFEPFFSRKEKDAHGGTGLGLSVVHRLVKDHKGYIDVESLPGAGTTISLYLPLYTGPVAEAFPVQRAEIQGGSESILIVDDEPGQRFLANQILSRLGYAVEEAENGRTAVERFAEHAGAGFVESPFGLVLLDMVMEQDFDVLDVLNAILALYPKQRVVIVSGYAKDKRAAATQALGAKWLSKPYLLTDLERRVRQTLDAPESASAGNL